MTETSVDLGVVTVPSGVLVLGMAGWIDHWSELGDPLSVRALAAVGNGGGHLHEPADGPSRDWSCEAVAVPAATDRPLTVRAEVGESYDGPVVTVLEVDLGLHWPGDAGTGPIRLGDLPVDRCGMVLGDARALDSFVGLSGESIDQLADVTYWRKYEDDAHALFGGERVPRYEGQGPYGRLDLPLHEAHEFAGRLRDWPAAGPRTGLVVSVDAHTHFNLLDRAGQSPPPARRTARDRRMPGPGPGLGPGRPLHAPPRRTSLEPGLRRHPGTGRHHHPAALDHPRGSGRPRIARTGPPGAPGAAFP